MSLDLVESFALEQARLSLRSEKKASGKAAKRSLSKKCLSGDLLRIFANGREFCRHLKYHSNSLSNP